jgi:hypothetical protein
VIEPAVGVGGEVSLRGLGPLVVAELLYGLQNRCLIERVQTKESDLRALCDDLRRQQVPSVGAYVLPPEKRRNPGYVGLASSLATHARRALATPESEVAGEVWDLAVFGHYGSVSFEGITQRWLKEAAKAWAADRTSGAGRHMSALKMAYELGEWPRRGRGVVLLRDAVTWDYSTGVGSS